MLSPDNLSATPTSDPATDPQKPSAFDPAKADAAAKAILAQGGNQHDVDTYLHQTYGLMSTEPGMQGHDYHAEYAKGLLGPRMARENTNDAEAAALEDPGTSGSTAGAFGRSLAATGANIAQGIPGMEAAQAGVRSVVRRQPYREALTDIQGQTGKIPGVLRVGEKIAGAVPLAAMLPANPVISGAVIGGADQALNADPDVGLGARAIRTPIGATVGAAIGGVADAAITAGRSALVPKVANQLIDARAARAAVAGKTFPAALAEGQGKTVTQPIYDALAKPDIAEIVAELKQTRPFQNVADDSPEMLDAAYKVLSDRAGQLKRGADAITPNRPNIGRFRAQDTKAAQSELMDAMAGTPAQPGPMPSYRPAVEGYANASRQIEATQRGSDVLKSKLSSVLPASRNLTRTTPEAFADWAAKATPEQLQAAKRGILGATKTQLFKAPLTAGRRAVFDAPALLRDVPTKGQESVNLLQNLGLLTAGNSTP